jgi:predicted dithiol-disulfide oxidoreductase (DUF899 family)
MTKTKSRPAAALHRIVSRQAWNGARLRLRAEEKKLFKAHDRLKARRRALPWVRIEKDYVFDGPGGRESLADLFGGKKQLVVYHFMFAPGGEACPHCSFWADHYDGISAHLGQRDTAFVVISRASPPELRAHQRRMGWKFKWVSSGRTDFNYDFHVSFRPEDIQDGSARYNYVPIDPDMADVPDREGASAFYRDRSGLYHTYSTFARGIDLLNGTYNFLDLTALGRHENPEASQDWVDYHDRY